MKQSEVIDAFVEIGWTKLRSPGGPSCIYELPDRFIEVVPKLKKLTGRQKLNLTPMVSTTDFRDAERYISQPPEAGGAMGVDFDVNNSLYAPEFTRKEIVEAAQSVIEWGIRQDLREILDSFRDLPTDAVGNLPLKHLTALALLGETSTLEAYKTSFAAGDTLGFVPYITAACIDRALGIANG